MMTTLSSLAASEVVNILTIASGATSDDKGAIITTSVFNAYSGLILSLRPTNERRRYFVTTSLIGWTQT